MASTDPVAIDQACLDMIKNTHDNGTEAFLDQVAKKEGENTTSWRRSGTAASSR